MSHEIIPEMPRKQEKGYESATAEQLIEEIQHHASEEKRKLSPEEETKIASLKAKIEESHEKIVDEVPEEELSTTPPKHRGIPFWRKAAALWSAVGTMIIPKQSHATNAEEVFLKHQNVVEGTTKEVPAPYEFINTKKDFGHVSLEGLRMIPQTDTTKEFFVAGFSDDGEEKDVFGKILAAMKAEGYEPADASMLERIYAENKDDANFKKYSRWMLAPIPETDQDDTRWNERILTPTEQGTWKARLPKHGVWINIGPSGQMGRWEINQGYKTNEQTILFYKKVNQTNYNDLVKTK